jgi:hypothetical protein
MPAVDLSNVLPETENAAPPVPTRMEVKTAFLVFMTPEGKWAATEDLQLALQVERLADADDMLAGAGKVHDDMLTHHAGMRTVTMINQQVAAQMQAAQNAQLVQSLSLGGK